MRRSRLERSRPRRSSFVRCSAGARHVRCFPFFSDYNFVFFLFSPGSSRGTVCYKQSKRCAWPSLRIKVESPRRFWGGWSRGRAADLGNSGQLRLVWCVRSPSSLRIFEVHNGFEVCLLHLLSFAFFQIPDFQIFVTREQATHAPSHIWTQQERRSDTETDRPLPNRDRKKGERHRGGNGSPCSSNSESSYSSGPKRCSARTSGQDDDGGDGPKGSREPSSARNGDAGAGCVIKEFRRARFHQKCLLTTRAVKKKIFPRRKTTAGTRTCRLERRP